MNTKVKSYRDLLVWQKSFKLVKLVCQLTRSSPAVERSGFVSQMRRAAVSLPSDLAEGHARNTTGESIQFVSHAQGPPAELETQVILSVELAFCLSVEVQPLRALIAEIQKMADALRCSLASRP